MIKNADTINFIQASKLNSTLKKKKTNISYVQFFVDPEKFYENNRFGFVYIFHNSDNLHKINIRFTERHNTLWWIAV